MIIKENKNQMNLEDWALHLIRHKLRKDYGDNFKTSLDVVADNVLSDFLAYIEDEASGFLINEITYDDGLVKGDKLRNAVQDFIDFDLRENDINEYDVDYTIDESLDEAREMHTWSVTYNGKGNKAKTHMVDAPDAYEANRKARRELGITYTDIDDVTMIENKKMNDRNNKIVEDISEDDFEDDFDTKTTKYEFHIGGWSHYVEFKEIGECEYIVTLDWEETTTYKGELPANNFQAHLLCRKLFNCI